MFPLSPVVDVPYRFLKMYDNKYPLEHLPNISDNEGVLIFVFHGGGRKWKKALQIFRGLSKS